MSVKNKTEEKRGETKSLEKKCVLLQSSLWSTKWSLRRVSSFCKKRRAKEKEKIHTGQRVLGNTCTRRKSIR